MKTVTDSPRCFPLSRKADGGGVRSGPSSRPFHDRGSDVCPQSCRWSLSKERPPWDAQNPRQSSSYVSLPRDGRRHTGDATPS